MKNLIYLIALICIVGGLASCQSDPNSPGIEYMDDMYRSPAVEYYSQDINPPSNTIHLDVASNVDGQEIYEVHCMLCHGKFGTGDGTIPATGKYPPPPAYGNMNLTKDEMFASVSNGKGAMGAYKYQLDVDERLAVVDYIQGF